METIFKVGDIVYDSVNYPNQKGKIKSIDKDSTYGVVVMFENEEIEDRYLNNGASSENRIPTLSFTPYELKGFSQDKPWTPKEGEWIAVKDYNSENDKWKIQKFKHMNRNNYVCDLSIAWNFAKPLTDFINER